MLDLCNFRWTFGVFIFELSHGYAPFRAENQVSLFEDILMARKRYKVIYEI